MKEKSYNYFNPMVQPYNFEDKVKAVNVYVSTMLNRTQMMFKYKNLPDTIPQRNLETMLQVNGNIFVTKVKGALYAFTGGLGGEPDVYYEPTIYTVANPALDFSKNLVIDKDGVLVRNDSFIQGLIPLCSRYATLLVENNITMKIADINTRITSFLSAPDDKTRKGALEYIKQIEDGRLGVIAETAFLDGVRVQPNANPNSNYMTQLIEFEQYVKATWFNDLGIQSMFNMKRETLNSSETQMNEDVLKPLVADMLEQRKIGIEKINNMYGTNITVELSELWKPKIEQVKDDGGEQDELEVETSPAESSQE